MTLRPSETTLYVAGPLTALKGTHEETARELLAAGYYRVLYPTADASVGWNNWFDFGVASILDADGVVLLPGTVKGRGGKLLIDLAFELGRPIYSTAKWVEQAAKWAAHPLNAGKAGK